MTPLIVNLAPIIELTDEVFYQLCRHNADLREYLENGVLLGWLLDPKTRRVEIYRPNQPPEILENSGSLSGGICCPVLCWT